MNYTIRRSDNGGPMSWEVGAMVNDTWVPFDGKQYFDKDEARSAIAEASKPKPKEKPKVKAKAQVNKPAPAPAKKTASAKKKTIFKR